MNNWQKAGIGLLVVASITYIKLAYFPSAQTEKIEEPIKVEETQPLEEVKPKVPKTFVTVYFIGQNSSKEEVYKAVKREYNSNADGSKLTFSIKALLSGPTAKEKSKGVYSEIPAGTKLLSVEESAQRVIINLSGDFEYGGGTDGLYKRLYQLIKTANLNTSNPSVYLYINGKQADVIGGEGIMINQPLNSHSLDE